MDPIDLQATVFFSTCSRCHLTTHPNHHHNHKLHVCTPPPHLSSSSLSSSSLPSRTDRHPIFRLSRRPNHNTRSHNVFMMFARFALRFPLTLNFDSALRRISNDPSDSRTEKRARVSEFFPPSAFLRGWLRITSLDELKNLSFTD